MQTERIPYAFILGLAHSGSTLLTFLLNAHPRIATLGEIERLRIFIPDRWQRKSDSCSCGRTFYECPYWNRVLAGFAARGHGFDRVDFFTYPPALKDEADRKLRALAEAVLEVSEASVFLDASKYARFVKPLLDNPHLDLRVLNLQRDGRATIHSWMKHLRKGPWFNRRLPKNWRGNPLIRPIVVASIILRWRRQEKERQTVLAGIPPDRVLTLKYEDLATEPEKTLASIFSFLKVGDDAEIPAGFKSEVEHHIIGNQMRLNKQEKIALDEKWRTELEKDALFLFRLLGGVSLNRQTGYVR